MVISGCCIGGDVVGVVAVDDVCPPMFDNWKHAQVAAMDSVMDVSFLHYDG